MTTLRLTFLLIVCSAANIFAQQQFGVVVDLNSNLHSADFRAFPGVPSCCPAYQSGSGSGVNLGLSAATHLADQTWLAARLQFNNYSATLTRTESLTLAGNIPGTVEHTVVCSLPALEVEFLLRRELFSGLSAELGPRFGHFFSAQFSQKELITQPSSGVFENGTRSRNVINNSAIPDLSSFNFGLCIGLSYSTPLNKQATLLLQPEVRYAPALSNVVSSIQWKSSQLQGGIGLVWCPTNSPARPERHELREQIDTVRVQGTEAIAHVILGRESHRVEHDEDASSSIVRDVMERRDTLLLAAVPKPKLKAPILSVVALDSANVSQSTANLRIEEFAAFPTTPLLADVFFDENSAEIPSRYHALNAASTADFKEAALQNRDRLQCYYDLLNVVGARMLAHPQAQLRLVGCNADIGSEKLNTALSAQRAQSARDYLSKVWGISQRRLKVESRNLPSHAANSQTSDGAQENRRVELISDDASILAPIDSKDTLRVLRTPSLRFHVDNNPTDAQQQLEIDIKQDVRLIAKLALPLQSSTEVEWKCSDQLSPLNAHGNALQCELHRSADNSIVESNVVRVPFQVLSVQQKRTEHVADEEISRYSLMMFDVRSSEISESNKSLVGMIRKQLQPAAKVSVIGYADRSGDARLNQQLALERAQSMARELGLNADADVQGQLDSVSYDQNLPEGRLYSRTVDIIVRSKVSGK